jgi:hypothetical protein
MGLSRSTFYAAPEGKPSDAELPAEICAITDVFECYGYLRIPTHPVGCSDNIRSVIPEYPVT